MIWITLTIHIHVAGECHIETVDSRHCDSQMFRLLFVQFIVRCLIPLPDSLHFRTNCYPGLSVPFQFTNVNCIQTRLKKQVY